MRCETNPSKGGRGLIQTDVSWQYLNEGGQSWCQHLQQRASEVSSQQNGAVWERNPNSWKP